MTHLIIPLATSSNYFPIEEYFFPKPLIDIDGLPMILKVMENFEKNLDFQKYIPNPKIYLDIFQSFPLLDLDYMI